METAEIEGKDIAPRKSDTQSITDAPHDVQLCTLSVQMFHVKPLIGQGKLPRMRGISAVIYLLAVFGPPLVGLYFWQQKLAELAPGADGYADGLKGLRRARREAALYGWGSFLVALLMAIAVVAIL
jgi:hypothetical protein